MNPFEDDHGRARDRRRRLPGSLHDCRRWQDDDPPAETREDHLLPTRGVFRGVAGAWVAGLVAAWALAVLLLPFALLAALLHYLTT